MRTDTFASLPACGVPIINFDAFVIVTECVGRWVD